MTDVDVSPSVRNHRRILPWLVIALLFGILLAEVVRVGWQAYARLRLGQALFTGIAGEASPRGRLPGHLMDLPLMATRCSNCHETEMAASSTTAAAQRLETFGPPLNAVTLGTAISRRGAPPTRYDQDSLCRVLREGIDPGWVMISQSMPRYRISDAQCAALWSWLSRRQPKV